MLFSTTAIVENDEICSRDFSFNTEDYTEWENMKVQPESLGENWVNIDIKNPEEKDALKYAKENIPTIKRFLNKSCALYFTIGAKIKVIF